MDFGKVRVLMDVRYILFFLELENIDIKIYLDMG